MKLRLLALTIALPAAIAPLGCASQGDVDAVAPAPSAAAGAPSAPDGSSQDAGQGGSFASTQAGQGGAAQAGQGSGGQAGAGAGQGSQAGSGGTSQGGVGGAGGSAAGSVGDAGAGGADSSSGGAGQAGSGGTATAGSGGAGAAGQPPQPAWDGSAPKASVPLSGGTLLVLSDGKTAVAADPDRDMVSFVDLVGKSVTAQIQLPDGAEPGRIVEDASGQVHVLLRRGGGVADIDVFSRTLVGMRQVCAMPRGVAYRAIDDALVVACLAGDLVTMSAQVSKKEPISRVKVTQGGVVVRDLRDVVVKGAGVLVTSFRSPRVYKVQPDGTVLGEPVSLNVRADTSAAQLAANGLSGGIEQSYVPTVAWRAIAGPEGDIVMVHEAGTDRVINIEHAADQGGTQQKVDKVCSSSGYGGTTCTTVFGKPICTPPVLIGAISAVSIVGEVSNGPALPNGALPVDLAITDKGYSVVLAGNPAGTVGSTGKALFNVLRVPAVDTSKGPAANSALFDGDLCGAAFTNGITVPGQPTSLAIDGEGREIVLSREPAALHIVSGSKIESVQLSPISVANDGFDLFHTNTGRGMTCAGCHAEGQDDGRTWRFTPGFDDKGAPLKVLIRRTQTFRAGFLDTAPFHWDGEFAATQDLMNDVFVHRMAAAKLPAPEKLAALNDWLNHIPPKRHDAPSPDEAKAIASGKALFEDQVVGCASCHGGPQFTNNKNADIGFGSATQVPALVDVAFRAPFLHDGSVPTLQARFTDPTALSGKHGKTDQLSPAQIADLVVYLESL